MVRFECDGCGVLKENGEPWILGFAAENIGVKAARREATIADAWDDRRSRDWLAVHFCSDECRSDYMGRLFSESPAAQGGTTKRIQRVVPGGVVETQVTERENPLVKRTVRRRKAS
jgi:hypothetical protein